MLDNLEVFHPEQVDVRAWVAFVGTFGSDEHQVSLSQQQLDLIDGPVLHQHLDVVQKLFDTIANARLKSDHKISREESLTLAMIPGEMERLIVVAQKGLVLLRFFQVLRLGRPIHLSVSAFVGRSIRCGKHLVLGN
jgi:hypothetical protein